MVHFGRFFIKLVFAHIVASASKQSLQAVVVDIGSTGSRIHVFDYKPTSCNGEVAVRLSLPEKSSKIRPGLSTVIETPDKGWTMKNLRDSVAEYMEKIRVEIDDHVPRDYRSTTPIWILGTAGMRHITKPKLDTVLSIMRGVIINWNDYKINPNWVDVLDGAFPNFFWLLELFLLMSLGEREGIYSWFALSQLLGRQLSSEFDEVLLMPGRPSTLGNRSVALVELGGASAQVVALPPVRTIIIS